MQGSTVAEPLIREIYAPILRAGGHALLLLQLPGNSETCFRLASDRQLEFIPEPLKLAMETYEAGATIMIGTSSGIRKSTGSILFD
ncbi:MAG: hypothetical protein AVO35_11825 [Candidatus Aegiribacteria sp. MLS_C]|nr:MAG: hypothetical protein AVO35_11825 [Candidatus Aegiribacteria sp. MLS_C]